MRIIQGDLVEMAVKGDFDVVIHGANCFQTMGSGIALQLRKVFPLIASADGMTGYGDIFKLGDYSYAVEEARNAHQFIIVNAYTQYHPGPDFHAWALQSVLYKLCKVRHLNKQTLVGVPWIGCGIGGSSPSVVGPIFEDFAQFVNLTVVELPKR